MAIFVDENTKVVYQGLTGSQGSFYGLRNRDYGTQVVAGVNPKKAGTDVDGIPVYATVAEAKEHMQAGHFAPGSMLPKIQAIIWFLEAGGQEALITDPENIGRALRGETGTRVVP